MKKTLKSIIGAVLAMLIALSGVSAFDLGNGLAAGERLACVKDALVRITDAVKSTLNYIGLFAGYYCALPF